jgi:folate-binding protein YgfZ
MNPDKKQITAPFFVKLSSRGLVHIEGEDRYKFLQALISNDIELLKKQPAIYACLLTPQGKFLHDFFILEGDGFILLDCEGGDRAKDLYNRLNIYRLRSDVTISVEDNCPVYACFNSTPDNSYPDPRHADMGSRCLYTAPEDIEEKPFEEWNKLRLSLGIPDGSRDMELEKSTLIECNIDKLGGVSFDKGCYVGQEVTARMHHLGAAKKHLYPVRTNDTLPDYEEIIELDEKKVGQMRSSCGDIGLALLRDDAFDRLQGGNIIPYKTEWMES